MGWDLERRGGWKASTLKAGEVQRNSRGCEKGQTFFQPFNLLQEGQAPHHPPTHPGSNSLPMGAKMRIPSPPARGPRLIPLLA